MGASTALVGSYETVAAAILDYVDLGADLVSIRGYDNLNDAIDYGRYVLPLVRSELAHRASTGQRPPAQRRRNPPGPPRPRPGGPRDRPGRGAVAPGHVGRRPAAGDGRARRQRRAVRPQRRVPLGVHSRRARGGPAHARHRPRLRRPGPVGDRGGAGPAGAGPGRPVGRAADRDDRLPAREPGEAAALAGGALPPGGERLAAAPGADQRRPGRARVGRAGPRRAARHQAHPDRPRLAAERAQGLRDRLGGPRLPPRVGRHRGRRAADRARDRARRRARHQGDQDLGSPSGCGPAAPTTSSTPTSRSRPRTSPACRWPRRAATRPRSRRSGSR